MCWGLETDLADLGLVQIMVSEHDPNQGSQRRCIKFPQAFSLFGTHAHEMKLNPVA